MSKRMPHILLSGLCGTGIDLVGIEDILYGLSFVHEHRLAVLLQHTGHIHGLELHRLHTIGQHHGGGIVDIGVLSLEKQVAMIEILFFFSGA